MTLIIYKRKAVNNEVTPLLITVKYTPTSSKRTSIPPHSSIKRGQPNKVCRVTPTSGEVGRLFMIGCTAIVFSRTLVQWCLADHLHPTVFYWAYCTPFVDTARLIASLVANFKLQPGILGHQTRRKNHRTWGFWAIHQFETRGNLLK